VLLPRTDTTDTGADAVTPDAVADAVTFADDDGRTPVTPDAVADAVTPDAVADAVTFAVADAVPHVVTDPPNASPDTGAEAASSMQRHNVSYSSIQYMCRRRQVGWVRQLLRENRRVTCRAKVWRFIHYVHVPRGTSYRTHNPSVGKLHGKHVERLGRVQRNVRGWHPTARTYDHSATTVRRHRVPDITRLDVVSRGDCVPRGLQTRSMGRMGRM